MATESASAKMHETLTVFTSLRTDLRSTWADARAKALDAQHLQPASDDYHTVESRLAAFDESSEKAAALAAEAMHQSAAATKSVDSTHDAALAANEATAEATVAGTRARDEARIAQSLVDQALRELSTAGGGCAPGMSVGAVEGELASRVQGSWTSAARGMLLRAFEEEVAWIVGVKAVEKTIERALGVSGGVDNVDAIADVVRDSHQVMRAQVVEAIESAKRRLGL